MSRKNIPALPTPSSKDMMASVIWEQNMNLGENFKEKGRYREN
jgi:hypothetical protein